MKASTYNQKGEQTGTIELPESIFDMPWNDDLVHQVAVSLQANKRTPIAHTKNRGEVRGGGKKPWRQKGTGQARHGSIRSPLWRGGGITFGPRNEKKYNKKINKKMKAKALFTALSQKLKDNEIIFVDKFAFTEPKSKQAKEIIVNFSKIPGFDALEIKKKNTAFFALGIKDKNIEKSFQNFGNILIDEARNLDLLNILTYKYLIISDPENVVKFLKDKAKKAININTDKFKTKETRRVDKTENKKRKTTAKITKKIN